MDVVVPARPVKQKWKHWTLVPALALGLGLVHFLYGVAVFGYIHEIALSSVGLFLFFSGFRIFRKRWLVQNMPTAAIRSVAMGFAELKGIAAQKCPLKSRITLADCVFYRFRIEKETRDSRGRKHWTVVDEGCSTNYFYVDDETGRILVDPLEAELMLAVDYRHDDLDKATRGRMRYTEWYLKPGDPVYVLGTVRAFRDAVQDRADRLMEKIRALKAEPARLMKFDADKDGQINAEEWDRARAAAEQELLEEELKTAAAAAGDDIVIAKGAVETTFLIADCAESEISKRFFLRSAGLIAGGTLLVLAMAVSLIARGGLLPATLAIPWEAFYRH